MIKLYKYTTKYQAAKYFYKKFEWLQIVPLCNGSEVLPVLLG